MRVSRILTGMALTTTALALPTTTAAAAAQGEVHIDPSVARSFQVVSIEATGCAGPATGNTTASMAAFSLRPVPQSNPLLVRGNFTVKRDAAPGHYTVTVMCGAQAVTGVFAVAKKHEPRPEQPEGRSHPDPHDSGHDDSYKSCRHGSHEEGRHDSYKPCDHDSHEEGRHDSYKPCDHDSHEEGRHDSYRICREDSDKRDHGKDDHGKDDHDKDDHGKDDHGKDDYDKGDHGKDDYGKDDYDKDDYGKDDYGKGDYGKGDYGKGDYGKGDYYAPYKPGHRDVYQPHQRPRGGAKAGIGGSPGMNTAEAAMGAGLIATAAGGGFYLLRRRANRPSA